MADDALDRLRQHEFASDPYIRSLRLRAERPPEALYRLVYENPTGEGEWWPWPKVASLLRESLTMFGDDRPVKVQMKTTRRPGRRDVRCVDDVPNGDEPWTYEAVLP